MALLKKRLAKKEQSLCFINGSSAKNQSHPLSQLPVPASGFPAGISARQSIPRVLCSPQAPCTSVLKGNSQIHGPSNPPCPPSPFSQSPGFFMYVHASLFTNEVLLDTNNACSPRDRPVTHEESSSVNHLKKYCTYFNLKPNLHRK